MSREAAAWVKKHYLDARDEPLPSVPPKEFSEALTELEKAKDQSQ